MSVNSLMINCVETQYTHEYIANVFWRQHIAKVSSITLIPYIKNSEIFSIAYINIAEWCDTETAYNFIKRLNDSSKEVRIVHHEDYWWKVQFNTHNNGDISVGAYTLPFDATYFAKCLEPEMTVSDDETAPVSDIDEDECICDNKELEVVVTSPTKVVAFRPMKVGNNYITVDEALHRLHMINKEMRTCLLSWDERCQASEERKNLETELRIYESVNDTHLVSHPEKHIFEKKCYSHLEDDYFSHSDDIIPGSKEEEYFLSLYDSSREMSRNVEKHFTNIL